MGPGYLSRDDNFEEILKIKIETIYALNKVTQSFIFINSKSQISNHWGMMYHASIANIQNNVRLVEVLSLEQPW